MKLLNCRHTTREVLGWTHLGEMDEDVTQRVEECVEEDWTHQSLNIFLVEVWQIMVLAIVDGLAEVLGEGWQRCGGMAQVSSYGQ